MPKRKKHDKSSRNSLDTFSSKTPRGRPRRMPASEIFGRAANYRRIFGGIWKELRGLLLSAVTSEDVTVRFRRVDEYHSREFVPALSPLILKVVQDKNFPKRPEAQVNFLADSLAGRGLVTPHSSRDICERERAKEKRAHRIIRYEFKIECSCGYKGFSRDHACPKCKAEIHFPPCSSFGATPF
jgi:hypothetical protein